MTDLDIQTAQLIIQLAREDIYGLDGAPDDSLLSDLEFALAAQEQEFMQHWTNYGDAQFTPGNRSGPSGGHSRDGETGSSNFGLVRPNVNQTSRTASITVAPAAPAPQLVASTSSSRGIVQAANVASSSSNTPSQTATRATGGSNGVPTFRFETPPSSTLWILPTLRPATSTHVVHEATRQLPEPRAEEQPLIDWTIGEPHQTVGELHLDAGEYSSASSASEDSTNDEPHQTVRESHLDAGEYSSASSAGEDSTNDEFYQYLGELLAGMEEEYSPELPASEDFTAVEVYQNAGELPLGAEEYSPASPASEVSSLEYEGIVDEWDIGTTVEDPISPASSRSISEDDEQPVISYLSLPYREEDEDPSLKLFSDMFLKMCVTFKFPAHTSHMCLG